MFAYKVAHLEVAHVREASRIEHASPAVRTAQAAVEEVLEANGEHEWQAIQAVTFTPRCATILSLRLGRNFVVDWLGTCNMKSVLAMFEHPKHSSTTHKPSEELGVIGERPCASTASKTERCFSRI